MSVQPSKRWKECGGLERQQREERRKAYAAKIDSILARAERDWVEVDGNDCQAVVDAYEADKVYVWHTVGNDTFAVILLNTYAKMLLASVRAGRKVVIEKVVERVKYRELIAAVKDYAKAQSNDAGKRLYYWRGEEHQFTIEPWVVPVRKAA